MTANAEIVLEEHPELAARPRGRRHLRRAEATPFVDVVDPGRRRPAAARVPVKVGVGNGTRIQVLDGAQAGRQGRPARLA